MPSSSSIPTSKPSAWAEGETMAILVKNSRDIALSANVRYPSTSGSVPKESKKRWQKGESASG